VPRATFETLLRALFLHTDIAFMERAAFEDQEGPAAGAPILLVDGREIRSLRHSSHWAITWQLAAALARRPEDRPRVAPWYGAIGALLLGWGSGRPHGASRVGLTLFERDPTLVVLRGTLHQTFGAPRLEQYMRHNPSAGGPPRSAGFGRGPLVRRGLDAARRATERPQAMTTELDMRRWRSFSPPCRRR
jgi:hypothetical protein